MTTQVLGCLALLFGPTHAARYEVGQLRYLQAFSRRRYSDNHAVLSMQTSTSKEEDVTLSRNAKEIQRLVRDLEEVIDDSGDILAKMFLSMSMAPISNGSGSDTASPTATAIPFPHMTTPEPTREDASGLSSTTPDHQSFSPTFHESNILSFLSDYPSLAPTGISETTTSMPTENEISNSLAPSNIPTSTPVPTSMSAQAASAYGCNGELIVGPNRDGTPISLTVGYQAESSSISTSIFVSSLERHLLETAVLAALDGCHGSLRRLLQNEEILPDDHHRRLLVETKLIGPCDSTLNDTESCTIMVTDVLFSLDGAVHADAATFAAYKAIETHMREDKYIGFVPSVLMLQYLTPLPFVAPSIDRTSGHDNIEPAPLRSSNADHGLQISPWTMGACVATMMGGVIFLII